MQWMHLDTTLWDQIPSFTFTDVPPDVRLVTPDQPFSRLPSTDAPSTDALWGGTRNRDSAASVPKVPFMWPETLVIYVDNTSSDFKNGLSFRMCTLLVAAGVFKSIRINMLIVGHTHDIVDQMFSVWSRQLKHNRNVPTIEEMHKLFRTKYGSKIYEIDALSRGIQNEFAPQPADPLLDPERVPDRVAERLIRLAQELGVQPKVVGQQFCVDVESWCYKKVNITNGIASAYNFFIKKGMSNDHEPTQTEAELKANPPKPVIWCYNRHLANMRPGVHPDNLHVRYPREEYGPWTTRSLMLDDFSMVPTVDPSALPPKPVDTATLRKTVEVLAGENQMDPLSVDRLSAPNSS